MALTAPLPWYPPPPRAPTLGLLLIFNVLREACALESLPFEEGRRERFETLGGFFAEGFFAEGFFAGGFLVEGFLEGGFLEGGFLAAGFSLQRCVTGERVWVGLHFFTQRPAKRTFPGGHFLVVLFVIARQTSHLRGEIKSPHPLSFFCGVGWAQRTLAATFYPPTTCGASSPMSASMLTPA